MKTTDLLRRLMFRLVPARHAGIYRFCTRYIDRFNGDNDSNPVTNGEYRFLEKEIGRIGSGTVFDVGANVGDWAAFAIGTNPQVRIHCFEPGASAYLRLAARKWPPNVRLNQFGLGQSEEMLEFHIIDELSGLNSLYMRQGVSIAKSGASQKIMIRTVDSYCAEHAIDHIDLIKVDVEGHELAVMKGMQRMLSDKRIDTIQFEYGGCALDARFTLHDVWQFLEPSGFRFFKLRSDGPHRVEHYDRTLETFRYSNWVARREGGRS